MRIRFGRDFYFYKMLELQADAAHRAAQEFHALSHDFEHLAEHIECIKKIELEADDVTHQLANKLDSTFVTPLDKEDIHDLSSGLDDITDFIEAGTVRLLLYRLTQPRPDLQPLVGLLVQITAAVREVVGAMRHMHGREALQGLFIRVHEIENEHDKAYRQALADLFNAPGADPLNVVKWKEIYDRIETAVDKCEDVANIVESVAVKYA